ncbi:MAG: hypothetical protein R2699_18010 [Acidimicrobiales bacterium]
MGARSSAFIFAVGHRFRDRITDPLVAWAMLTLFVVAGFFFFLLAGPANPSHRAGAARLRRKPGPNPLQRRTTSSLAVHPPMLCLGYVGFTVPFRLRHRRSSPVGWGKGGLWLETRRWTRCWRGASCRSASSSAGGGHHEVLGWGGYWAWDPVESTSLLP